MRIVTKLLICSEPLVVAKLMMIVTKWFPCYDHTNHANGECDKMAHMLLAACYCHAVDDCD